LKVCISITPEKMRDGNRRRRKKKKKKKKRRRRIKYPQTR
jgi:hypothetical protein